MAQVRWWWKSLFRYNDGQVSSCCPRTLSQSQNTIGSGVAIKVVQAVSRFQAFVEKLYFIYSMSQKDALAECSSALGKQMVNIGTVLAVRWVVSFSEQ